MGRRPSDPLLLRSVVLDARLLRSREGRYRLIHMEGS